MAEVLYERGELDLALTRVMKGLEYIHLWSKADDMVLAHAILSRIKTARGEYQEADTAIKNGIKIVETRGVFPECRIMILSAEARLEGALTDVDAFGAWERSGDVVALEGSGPKILFDITMGLGHLEFRTR